MRLMRRSKGFVEKLCVSDPLPLSIDASPYRARPLGAAVPLLQGGQTFSPPCKRGRAAESGRGSLTHHVYALLFSLFLLSLTSCRQYMADQPRYNPYRESGFFADGMSARPLPEGTIPQGFERAEPSVTVPFPITMDVLKRGQERFEIFCTPCHDHMGTG